MRNKNIQGKFGRRFRMGGYSAFAAVMVVCIVIVINLICASLPASVTQLDATSGSLYSLSEQTRLIAESVHQDVHVYLIATTGQEDPTIARLLSRYSDLNSHIHVEYVDPVANPAFVEEHELSLNTLYANSVLLCSDERTRLVSYPEIYTTTYKYDYTYGEYVPTPSFSGENALTNALHYVSAARLPKVYFLTGHGESVIEETYVNMMSHDNLETADLSLLSEESVPADADALFIHVPQTDITEEEAAKLIAYLDNGGSILMITNYMDDSSMPNLRSIAQHMGMDVQTGLVLEGDHTRHLSQYPFYLLPEIAEHEITAPVLNGGYYILAPLSQPIVNTASGATVTTLLTTSESAYLKADGLNASVLTQEETDETGKYNIAALSEQEESKLCWFTSSIIFTTSADKVVSGANSDLVLNALGYLCGQGETISIRPKSLEVETLSVPASDNTLWSIVLIGVLPAAVIATGIVVCVRRKKR